MPPPLPLSCVVVDNNEIDRFILEHLVELTSSLRLAASFASPVQALDFLQAHADIDVVLLDIEMPELNGLELVRMLTPPHPAIILVTTHRTFAVDAFELHVADYLVKPVSYARFREAIDLVGQRQRQAAAPRLPGADENSHPAATEPMLEVVAGAHDLFVKVNSRLVRLNFNEVLYVEAMSTYSVFVTAKQKYIVHLTLKSIAERLPFAHFRRVHRSYIVNTKLIDTIEDNVLNLAGHEVPLAKSYQDELLQSLRSL